MVDHRLARAWISDFNPYSQQGRVRAQLDFTPSALGHLPSTAIWALPLASAELPSAAAALGAISLALLLIEILRICLTLGAPVPFATAWLAFSLVASSPVMRYHIAVGQLSMAIAFFIFGAWLCARRGQDVLAGLALGAACSMKPFPGIVVLYFLLMGRWKVPAAAVTL